MKRLTLLVGNYGSGKTEIALDTALHLAQQHEHVALVDLDIVNPYFRSAEHEIMLSNAGIRVLKPTFAGSAVDIPALGADIQSIFDRKDELVVMDIGGDDTGATALGRYQDYFAAEEYDMFFVINTCRPLASNAEDILDLMARVESRSQLRITGLINNTNLIYETTIPVVLEGQAIVEEVALRSGIAQTAIVVREGLKKDMPASYQLITREIPLRMRLEWMDQE